MKRRFKSKIGEAIHELASGLHRVGALPDAEMARYERSCLSSSPLPPEGIRELRTREALSQADFARRLNVTPGLISKWERGEKRPSGPSLKLLDVVRRKGLDAIS